jgi:hypothetical protein
VRVGRRGGREGERELEGEADDGAGTWRARLCFSRAQSRAAARAFARSAARAFARSRVRAFARSSAGRRHAACVAHELVGTRALRRSAAVDAGWDEGGAAVREIEWGIGGKIVAESEHAPACADRGRGKMQQHGGCSVSLFFATARVCRLSCGQAHGSMGT